MDYNYLDELLFDINSGNHKFKASDDQFTSEMEWLKYRNHILYIIDNIGLATKLIDNTLFITEKGHEVIKNGGWTKHLEKKYIDAEKLETSIVIETKLAKQNIKSIKFQRKYTLFATILTIISILITVYQLL